MSVYSNGDPESNYEPTDADWREYNQWVEANPYGICAHCGSALECYQDEEGAEVYCPNCTVIAVRGGVR
jgi:hypothetical protein